MRDAADAMRIRHGNGPTHRNFASQRQQSAMNQPRTIAAFAPSP
jgi:hypothetical protein